MHELSIAMSLIDVASEEAMQRGVEVVAIHLRLGPLSGVVKEALLSAFELAREGSFVSEARLAITDVPIVVYCAACQAEATVASAQDMRCPECGEATPDIRRGRELEIFAMEVVDDSSDAPGGSTPESAQAK